MMMKKLKRYLALSGLAVALVQSSCAADKAAGPAAGTTVIRGTVSDGAQAVSGAVITASTGGATASDITDPLGAYLMVLDGIPDSVRVCVASVNHADTCADFFAPPDTLVADWLLAAQAARDTVWISSDTVFAGDTAEIFVILINPDSAIASLNLWLQSSDSSVVYDTLEVLPARFPLSGMLWQSGRHDSLNLMSILAFTNISNPGNILAGAGAIMRLTYATDALATPGIYTLDTSSVLLLPNSKPLDIAYPSGTSVPRAVFIPGEIVIQ